MLLVFGVLEIFCLLACVTTLPSTRYLLFWDTMQLVSAGWLGRGRVECSSGWYLVFQQIDTLL